LINVLHINRSYQQQFQQFTTLQADDSNTTINITPKPESDVSTATTTKVITTHNPTSIPNNTNVNESPNYCTTATNTSSINTVLDESPSSSNIIKDES